MAPPGLIKGYWISWRENRASQHKAWPKAANTQHGYKKIHKYICRIKINHYLHAKYTTMNPDTFYNTDKATGDIHTIPYWIIGFSDGSYIRDYNKPEDDYNYYEDISYLFNIKTKQNGNSKNSPTTGH